MSLPNVAISSDLSTKALDLLIFIMLMDRAPESFKRTFASRLDKSGVCKAKDHWALHLHLFDELFEVFVPLPESKTLEKN